VALTFDDGPNEPYTSQIVDLMSEQGVVGTFFQVGRCVERHPGSTRAIAAAGHLIGNHGYSHRFWHYAAEPSLRGEIARTQQVLGDELGAEPTFFRPPWLFHPPALLRAAASFGLTVVSGSFAYPWEVLQPPAPRMVRHVVNRVQSGAIIIFHDGFDGRGGYRGTTVDAVRLTIEELSGAGYRFVRLDSFLPASPAVASA
jgi:peptidoglycan/xylan/chitin deacetylase (PgdA/CDA1 family)